MSAQSTSGGASSATPSPRTPSEPDGLRVELAREARRIEEDAEFSAKGHYNAAVPWQYANRIIGGVAALAAFGATASVLKNASPAVTATAAVVAGVLTAVLTFLDPRRMATRHQEAGNRYLDVRNRARIFANIEVGEGKAVAPRLIGALKRLSSRLASIRADAPQIPRAAYEAARRDIEDEGRTVHRVDKAPEAGQGAGPA